MDKPNKNELKARYKERTMIGGVYVVRNTQNGKFLLESAQDIQGSKNRFDFSQKTNSCVSMKLQKDWAEQGAQTFAFELLEELTKGETQTDAEFKADLQILKEMWAEKLGSQGAY